MSDDVKRLREEAAIHDRAAACVEHEERARKAAPLGVTPLPGRYPEVKIDPGEDQCVFTVEGTPQEVADRLRATALALEDK